MERSLTSNPLTEIFSIAARANGSNRPTATRRSVSCRLTVRSGAALFLLRDLDLTLPRGRGPVHGADVRPLPDHPPRTSCRAPRPPRSGGAVAEVGCPIGGCGHRVIGPWELEDHAAAAHPGWVATYELVRPYPNQLQLVVYRQVQDPPAT